jgi:hypothetical protein
VGLSTSFDAAFFGRLPESLFMALDDVERKTYPIARILLTNLVLSVASNEGALRLSAGAGDVRVLDARVPTRTLHPIFLHCGAGPLRRNDHSDDAAVAGLREAGPAFADPVFGFTTEVGRVKAGLPLQVRLNI